MPRQGNAWLNGLVQATSWAWHANARQDKARQGKARPLSYHRKQAYDYWQDQPGSIPFRRRLRARQTTLRVECSPRARQSYVSSENASNWTIGGPKTPRPLNAPHPRSQAETCGPSQSHDESWVDRDTSTATMSSCCPRRERGGKGQREAPFLNNR
ncbi:hypothetical protein GBA52_025995 [Prunus armeniaca]|nr:hypothetical protein GBA52_025995 [Prunus armeniaca]